MAEVCATCGLPKDLCVCGTISMEQQLVKVRLETRKWGKATTIIEGIDSKSVNLNDLGAKLKTLLRLWRDIERWPHIAAGRPSEKSQAAC